MAHGAWCMVYGVWCMVYGACCQVWGVGQGRVQGSGRLEPRVKGGGCFFRVQGAGCRV